MRIARVLGIIALSQRLPELPAGSLLLCETLDAHAVEHLATGAGRRTPMPESLVVFDMLGAGVGQLIALSEGREACVPFEPKRVAIDAYCAALIDTLSMGPNTKRI